MMGLWHGRSPGATRVIDRSGLRRALAVLRGEFPCLFCLGWIFVGQLLGFYLPEALVLALPGLFFRPIGTLLLLAGAAAALSAAPPLPAFASAGPWLAVVTAPPERRQAGGVTLLVAVAPADAETADWISARCRGIDLPWRNLDGVREGDAFIFSGEVAPLTPGRNPFSRDGREWRNGIQARCSILHATRPMALPERRRASHLREDLLERIRARRGDTETVGLTLAMSIGTRDVLSQPTEEAFRRTGLAHLLVVSGYQVMLVFAGLRLLLVRALWWVPRRWPELPIYLPAALGAAGGAGAFIWLVGLEGSTVRAGLAALLTVTARVCERGRGFFHPILVSLLLLSQLWPGAWLEPGVHLTYAALLGLCLGAAIFESPRWASWLSACLTASLATSLVSLLWFRSFSLVGLALNPLAAPLMSLLTCNGGLAAILVFLLGLDREATLFGFVVSGVALMRALVLTLAESPLVPEEESLLALVSAAVIVLSILVAMIVLQTRRFLLTRGVVRPFPRLLE